MTERTRNERRVVELSATLPDIRQTDIEWIRKDYKRVYKNKYLAYYLILERCKEFQVIRYYYKTRKRLFEFMQVWMDGKNEVTLAKKRFMRVDGWVEDSPMKVKRWGKNVEYSYMGGLSRIPFSGCKVRSVIPELKKRGIKTSCHNIHPYFLCHGLFNNPRVETLFKLRQYIITDYFAIYNEKSEDIWQSVRMALRHGYHFDSYMEFRDWRDMLNDLNYLGLDTRNPHYICPPNLKEAHIYWNERCAKRREREFNEKQRERREMEAKRMLAYESIFEENRKQFFGMVITDGDLNISIIPTISGIIEEGKKMHHCVGGYYDKPYSLIMSAKKDGNRVETIEVDLKTYTLIQSRGLCNEYTEYHERIVNLINSNMDEIVKRNAGHKMIEEFNKVKVAV